MNFDKLDNGITIRGWTITRNKSNIGSDVEMKTWSEHLKLSILPEMVFGNNFLKIKHNASDQVLCFNCIDALDQVNKTTAPNITVLASEAWRQGNLKTLEGMVGKETISPFDWTFSTEYKGTISSEMSVTSTEEKIDLVKLQQPDPILFYDEIILYEDELGDNGTSTVSLRVRVMPTCLFVLQRFYLRVDGVLFKQFDTRIFLQFHQNYCIRECSMKESDYQSILDQLNQKYEELGISKIRDNVIVSELLPQGHIVCNEKVEFVNK
jgi:type 2A phosphatase activator TIP41